MSKPRKHKKCKVCKGDFMPFQTTQKVCSPTCAIALVKSMSHREFNRKTREMRAAIKPRAKWMKEAQAAFNKFIRLRDAKEPCISCGTTKQGIQYAAGHYKTAGGYPELRFNEENCHKQCNTYCNMERSGNIIEYRPRLIDKIGLERVEWIEGKHEAKKYTVDDLKIIKAKYTAMAKELENNLK